MSFLIRNLTAAPIEINDLGLTIDVAADLDLRSESANSIAISEDLISFITAGGIVLLDPVDNVTQLTTVDSLKVINRTNSAPYGIQVGGSLVLLEDVVITTPIDNEVLAYDIGTNTWINTTSINSDGSLGNITVTVSYPAADKVVILVDTTNTAVNITLPDVSTVTGKFYHVKWITGSRSNKVKILTQLSQMVDGYTDVTLGHILDNLNIYSDGSNWWIL